MVPIFARFTLSFINYYQHYKIVLFVLPIIVKYHFNTYVNIYFNFPECNELFIYYFLNKRVLFCFKHEVKNHKHGPVSNIFNDKCYIIINTIAYNTENNEHTYFLPNRLVYNSIIHSKYTILL